MADNDVATSTPMTEGTELETSDDAVDFTPDDNDDDTPSVSAPWSAACVRAALVTGVLLVAVLSGLTCWLGYRALQSHRAQQEHNLVLQVGRQGALNLTTIDYAKVDTDVQRILDSSTGSFHDDFKQRAPAFIDAVKQAQSKSEGSVTEAGLETTHGDQAQVLVAVTVKTSNAGTAEPEPRLWRMRISVQNTDNGAKVSDVEFVP